MCPGFPTPGSAPVFGNILSSLRRPLKPKMCIHMYMYIHTLLTHDQYMYMYMYALTLTLLPNLTRSSMPQAEV